MKRWLLPSLFLGLVTTSNVFAFCDSIICLPSSMPHYDQNGDDVYSKWHLNSSKSTNLCIPTSAAMVTQQVLNTNNDLRWSSNLDVFHSTAKSTATLKSFNAFGAKDKVEQMAVSFDTIKDWGTSMSTPIKYFENAAKNYFTSFLVFLPGGRSQSSYDMAVSAPTLKSHTSNYGAETAAYIGFGHYSPKLSGSYFGIKFYTFGRNGGHGIAQAGYIGNSFYIYDPWYRNKYFTEISAVTATVKTIDTVVEIYSLPNGLTRASVLKANVQARYYPIIENSGSYGKRKYW